MSQPFASRGRSCVAKAGSRIVRWSFTLVARSPRLTVPVLVVALFFPASRLNRATAAETQPGSVASSSIREPWRIDLQNPTIPKQAVQGLVRGTKFVARTARLDSTELIISGNGELRMRSKPATGPGINQSFPSQLEAAKRFNIATLLLDKGGAAKSFQIQFKDEKGVVSDLTADAAIRLVLQAPEDNKCKGQLHLGLGEKTKDYLLGHFEAEMSPELAARIEKVKPMFPQPVTRKKSSSGEKKP